MEILGDVLPSRIDIDLHMIKPFEGRNKVVFTLEPKGGATAVTWAMDGKSAYFVKVMGIFMNMDNMIGKDFADGLANLKRLVEG